MAGGLPNIPAGLPSGLKNYLEKLAENVQVSDAQRGSPLQSKPTFKDLVDIGLISVNSSQALKSNGKSFQLTNGVGQWVSIVAGGSTGNTDPPVASNLVVTLNTSNIVLYWDAAPSLLTQTLIYRSTSNNLSTAVLIGSTIGTTYVDNLPPSGSVYFYWLKQSLSGRTSGFNQVSGTTIGNVAGAPTISYVFSSTDFILSWPTPTSALLIKYYVVKYGPAYIGGVVVGTSNTNTLRSTVDFGGSRTYWIAPVDVNDQVGLPGSVVVTVVPPAAPTVAQTIQNDALVLTYSAAAGSIPVASYEVRYGASWAAGLSLTAGANTRFEQAVNWAGARIFWIASYDSAGNVGPATQITFSPVSPSAVTVNRQVIDNNVLLSWTSAVGDLSIDYYLIDRNGTAIGKVGGNFSVVFEAVSATYVYGVTGYDTAGNAGVRSTTSAVVQQPPDFVLYSDINSGFAGTLTNALIDSGSLIACMDNTETWATHFTSRSWTSIADQIAAGYTSFLVGKTTGSYVETIDYGVTIASTRITMTPSPTTLFGAVSITPMIETSPNGSTWTTIATGAYSAVGTSFRYVRYTLNFASTHTGTGLATDTSGLIAVRPLNYRLDSKSKQVRNMVSALSTDAGGTAVDITGLFLDVTAIEVTPQGTTPLYCVYDFVDAPSPTTFKVLVFNSSGARVSATVSYTVSGV